MNQEGNQGTERASKKMRIFFSYGHRGHTEKVQIIKEALCARGHQVWIDENNIKAGNDWRRKITQGIKESQMVLAFLSKYSMRDPGVCRDELQISIGCKGGNIKAILLEPMQEVCPPATLSHSQWIDISNWNGDVSESGEIIEKIIKAVETEDNFIFSDEIDLLRQILNPVTYESRIKELCAKRMFGRKWLFEILRKWDEDNRSNFFWLMGGAGFGKSMFSANLCTYLSDKVVAAQFIEWDKPHIYESTAIIKNLAFQLAKRYPDYRKFIVNLPVQTREKLCRHYSEGGYSEEELCDILFCEQAGLCIDGEHESAWVILDALDEASQNGVNTIAGTIARHLSRFPKWLKFIVTSRNDDAVQRALQGHQPNVYDLDHIIHKYQEDDMREYLQDELQGKYSDSVLNSLIRKSSGMFLYLHFACENILAQNMTAQEIENLPQGISGIYSGYFERQFSGEKFNIFVNEVRPVLELCRSAYENLSLDLLSDMLEWNKEQLLSAISYLGTLKIDREENGVQYFHLCHKSIWDWLENQRAGFRSFRVTREYGQKQLVEFCLKKIGEYKMEELIKKPVYSYPLRHVISHLIEQKNESEIWNLLGGIDPLLPRIQYDYFENYASVMESYRHAIRFYFELYAETQKPQVLPKLCRLILTYKKFFAEQQKQLQDVFAPDNSLTKALEIMEGISDIKAYFVIGCYLLSQTTKRQWNKDELIDAIVKHCGDDLDDLDSDCANFLANGPFSDIVSELTAEQLIKILKIIDDEYTRSRILEGIQQKTTCPQLTQALWFFDKSDDVDRGVLGSFKEFETETVLERIRQIDEQSDRIEALSNFAVTLCLQGKYSEACNILSEAEKNLEGGHWWSGTISDLVETYHAIGKDDNAHRTILEHKEDLTRDLFDFINLLCKCSYNKEAYQYFEEHFLTDNQECTGMLSKYVSIRELLGDLQENAQLKTAYELFQNCDSSRKDELLKFRDIQLLLARFREAGYQVEELPAEENSETPKHSLNEISNFEECFDFCSTFMAKDIPLDKQLEYIELAWNLFEKELENQENLLK